MASYPHCYSIRDIRAKVKKVNAYTGGNKLKIETRDLKELFHATMESALANTIYFIACGSFTFAILLTAFNAFNAITDGQDGHLCWTTFSNTRCCITSLTKNQYHALLDHLFKHAWLHNLFHLFDELRPIEALVHQA